MARRLDVREKYNRALQIADYIIEGGHSVDDVVKEFRICRQTYQSDMRLLCSWGYGEEHKRNLILYAKVRAALHNERIRRRREKGE